MYVIVDGRFGDAKIHEADNWSVGEDEHLYILKNGKVIATHSGGAWESVYFSEGEND